MTEKILELLKEKLSKKQIVAVVGMVLIFLIESDGGLVLILKIVSIATIAMFGIYIQSRLDNKGEINETQK